MNTHEYKINDLTILTKQTFNAINTSKTVMIVY